MKECKCDGMWTEEVDLGVWCGVMVCADMLSQLTVSCQTGWRGGRRAC